MCWKKTKGQSDHTDHHPRYWWRTPQEANYGLLSIAEIGNLIVAIKSYVPVIGLVPGRVGSFGGMSITSALMSYLIATKARIGLNGPEVIEQEAGVREFDSSDKDLIWNTIGAKQRLKHK